MTMSLNVKLSSYRCYAKRGPQCPPQSRRCLRRKTLCEMYGGLKPNKNIKNFEHFQSHVIRSKLDDYIMQVSKFGIPVHLVCIVPA